MIGLMALALASVLSPATIAAEVRDITSANVYFSPEESGLKVLCSQIDAAQTHIRVAAFHFAETPMLDALIRAHQRGVKVEVVLDHEHIEYRPKKAAPNVKDGPVRINAASRSKWCLITSTLNTAQRKRHLTSKMAQAPSWRAS